MTDVLSWIRLPGPFLIGHRGYPAAARENTPASFEAALEAGCDGVELDVRFCRDGHPVVHHDEVAVTPEGDVRLDQAGWDALREARMGTAEDPYRIHDLEEVLRGLAGRCLIDVEVKPVPRDRRAEAAERVLRLVSRVRPRESVLLSSFDPGLLQAVQARDRSVALGYLFASAREFNHLEEDPVVEGLFALLPRHDLIDARLLKRARERALAVLAWTVDDPGEMARLARADVLGVITNRPDQGASLLHSDIPRR